MTKFMIAYYANGGRNIDFFYDEYSSVNENMTQLIEIVSYKVKALNVNNLISASYTHSDYESIENYIPIDLDLL